MKIVFSVPVHERAESVLDMIENIFAFNEDSGVALHLSKPFDISDEYISEKRFFEILSRKPYASRVVINPTRYDTKRVKGGVHLFLNAHCGNFDAACEKFGDFEYFVFMASNEIYFQKGAYDVIKNYDAGFSSKPFEKWSQYFRAKDDPRPRQVLRDLGIKEFTVSMCEGTFYKREVFKKIRDIMMPYIDPNLPPTGYAMEEFILPTISRYVVPVGKNYDGGLCRINLGKNLDVGMLADLLKQTKFFSYKRVRRNYKSVARLRISTRLGKYHDTVENLLWTSSEPMDPTQNKNVDPIIIQLSKVLFDIKNHLANARTKSDKYLDDLQALSLYTSVCGDNRISVTNWKDFIEDLLDILRFTIRRLDQDPNNQLLLILENAVYRKLAEIYAKFSGANALEKWQLRDGIILAVATRDAKRFPPTEFEISACEAAKN